MSIRRLIAGLVGLNVLLLAMLFAQSRSVQAAKSVETLRAQAIELVDERGRVRAQLNVEKDGAAVFRLRDSKGEIRVKLGADRDGSGLLLLDGATEPAVHMLAGGDGPSVTLRAKGGQVRTITPQGP